MDIGGTAGTVKEIKLFSVKIVTPDNLTVVIPNSTVLESVITNYSRMSLRRLDVVVPVSYNADVGKVKALVTEFIQGDARIASLPAPFFRLTERVRLISLCAYGRIPAYSGTSSSICWREF